MSFEDGWAAINLQMPKRVPHTEYSHGLHHELIKAVTGIEVTNDSPDSVRSAGMRALDEAWNLDFFWNVFIGSWVFPEKYRTDMGHASYQDQGADFRPVGQEAFADPEKVLNIDFTDFPRLDQKQLVKQFEEHYARAVENRPFGVNMTGIYTTLMSGLIDMLGWDMLLLAAGTDAVRFGELANRYAQWNQQYFDAMAASSVPVFMVHDDIVWTGGAFIHPDWYRKYIFPNYKKFFAPLRDAGKKIMYTSDGNFTEFIDDVVASGVHGLVMEPSTDMAYIAEKYGKTHSFIGNADTRILLSNHKPAIRAEVERCMAIGKKCPGFFLAVGNHIPPNTPVDAALYYHQCYLEMSQR